MSFIPLPPCRYW